MKAKLFTVATHLAGWVLFLSLPVLFAMGMGNGMSKTHILVAPSTWLFFLTYVILFYVNVYLLLPRLFNRKRFAFYAAAILMLFAAVFFLRPYDRMIHTVQPEQHARQLPPPQRNGEPRQPPPPPRHAKGEEERGPRLDVISIFLFLLVIALGITMHISYRLRTTEKRAVQAEAGKAQAELSFLKAQINPHFLFNTLNNIYSMAMMKNENTAGSILRLSNIMRYVTDEARAAFVPLKSELDCVRDYILLQELRLGDKTKVEWEVAGEITGYRIAPLLLLSFVENVFKYGVSNHEASVIQVSVQTMANAIRFKCRNRVFENRAQTGSTGIGIANSRQRLDLLYPGKHTLVIKEENGYFTVELLLQS